MNDSVRCNAKQVVGPLQDGIRDQLVAIAAHDHVRLPVLGERPIELASNPPEAPYRDIADQRQILAGAIAYDHEDAHPAAINE